MTKRDAKFLLRSTLNNIVIMAVLLLVLFAYKSVASEPELGLTSAKEVEKAELVVDDNVEIDLPVGAFAVFDIATGEIFFSKNETSVLPIASVTKLVTAVAVSQNWLQNTKVTISETDVMALGEAGKLKVGQEYTYRELLFPLLLESSNDAAETLERNTSQKVIEEMNEYVKSVGAKQTKFSDASGLSSGNVSSVSDLAKILSDLHRNHSEILDITQLSKYVGEYTGWVNNNPIFGESYKGGKHGYTEASNRTVVSIFEERFGDEKMLVGYIVLGSDNLKNDVSTLRQSFRQAVTFE